MAPLISTKVFRVTHLGKELCLLFIEEKCQKLELEYRHFLFLMYQSNRSFNIPPRAYPGHLTSFLAREGGNLINLVFPGELDR